MAFDGRTVERLFRAARQIYQQYRHQVGGTGSEGGTGGRQRPARQAPERVGRSAGRAAAGGAGYPGDYTGRLDPVYSPRPDGRPDPGEIVWTWVPYREDHTRGKDRPVLLVGRDGPYLLALMLTSKDHTGPGHRDARYVDVGTGAWDRQGRASEVLLDRVLRVDPEGIRREGAVMDRQTFQVVTRALAEG